MQRTVILILAFLLVWSAGLPALAAPASPQPAASPQPEAASQASPQGEAGIPLLLIAVLLIARLVKGGGCGGG